MTEFLKNRKTLLIACALSFFVKSISSYSMKENEKFDNNIQKEEGIDTGSKKDNEKDKGLTDKDEKELEEINVFLEKKYQNLKEMKTEREEKINEKERKLNDLFKKVNQKEKKEDIGKKIVRCENIKKANNNINYLFEKYGKKNAEGTLLGDYPFKVTTQGYYNICFDDFPKKYDEDLNQDENNKKRKELLIKKANENFVLKKGKIKETLKDDFFETAVTVDDYKEKIKEVDSYIKYFENKNITKDLKFEGEKLKEFKESLQKRKKELNDEFSYMYNNNGKNIINNEINIINIEEDKEKRQKWENKKKYILIKREADAIECDRKDYKEKIDDIQDKKKKVKSLIEELEKCEFKPMEDYSKKILNSIKNKGTKLEKVIKGMRIPTSGKGFKILKAKEEEAKKENEENLKKKGKKKLTKAMEEEFSNIVKKLKGREQFYKEYLKLSKNAEMTREDLCNLIIRLRMDYREASPWLRFSFFIAKPIASLIWSSANIFFHFEKIYLNQKYFLSYILCFGYRWQPNFMKNLDWFIDFNISLPSVVYSLTSTIMKYNTETFYIFNRWKWLLRNIFLYTIPRAFNFNLNIKIKGNYISLNFSGIIFELINQFVLPKVGMYYENDEISKDEEKKKNFLNPKKGIIDIKEIKKAKGKIYKNNEIVKMDEKEKEKKNLPNVKEIKNNIVNELDEKKRKEKNLDLELKPLIQVEIHHKQDQRIKQENKRSQSPIITKANKNFYSDEEKKNLKLNNFKDDSGVRLTTKKKIYNI